MKGWAPQKFDMPLETREIKHFWRDIPRFRWDIPAVPKKLGKKKVCVQFLAPNLGKHKPMSKKKSQRETRVQHRSPNRTSIESKILLAPSVLLSWLWALLQLPLPEGEDSLVRLLLDFVYTVGLSQDDRGDPNCGFVSGRPTSFVSGGPTSLC